MKISLAPMQGYSDYVYRNAYRQFFEGIDKFYTPFIVLQSDGSVRSLHKKEIEYYSEDKESLTPQFATSDASEYTFFENYFTEKGYSRMNWNMGCPFPMLLSKNRGCGLLAHSQVVDDILAKADLDKIKLSVKVRLGHKDNSELKDMLEVLNKYPIDEIIIHPRIGIQKYKGDVDFDKFEEYMNMCKHKLTINGDIRSIEDIKYIQERFPNIDSVMIGRGLLANVFLPLQIKGISLPEQKEAKQKLKAFHECIYSEYTELLSGNTQILSKLKPFWEYFSMNFVDEKKVFKKIKKAGSIKNYLEAVRFAFDQDLSIYDK